MGKGAVSTRMALLAGLLVLTAVLATSCGKPATPKSKAEGIVDSMVKGDFASATADFNATVKPLMPAEKLGQLWAGLTQQLGPFKARTDTREAQEQGYKCVYVTCQFEKAYIDIKVVFDGSNEVSGFFVLPNKASLGGK